MKNKFEDWCYVCGELVPEEAGIAEQIARKPGDAGWGPTKWVVRHKTCRAEQSESRPSSRTEETK